MSCMLAILPCKPTSPMSLIVACVCRPNFIKSVKLLLSTKIPYCLKTPKSGLAAVALMKASALPFNDKMRWNRSARLLVSTVTS